MATSSNKMGQGSDAEPFQQVVNETYPHPSYAPPPYQAVAGPSPSYAPQGVQGQSFGANYYPPMSNQPSPMMNYSYTYLQPATGEPTFPGCTSPLPNAVPVSPVPQLAVPPVNRPAKKSSSCWIFAIIFIIIVFLKPLSRANTTSTSNSSSSSSSYSSYSYQKHD